MPRISRLILLALATSMAAAAPAPAFAQKIQINGAGATFPYPIYSKWFSEYNKLHPEVEINYQSIGSGGGIRQLTNQTVFFGASDGPMTNEQLQAAPGPILHFPMVLGGVVPVYNVPGVTAELKFTGKVLADIYLGRITKWNDPAISGLNPGVKLPATDIAVVHRSDGSGTTYIWVDYLSKVSPDFKRKVGVATSVNWPVGVGGKGNEGVAGLVKQTPGSIGYVELAYLLENNMAYALVQNKAGTYVYPSVETVAAAAATKPSVSSTDFSIVDTDCAQCYPVSGYSWVMLYKKPQDAARGKLLKEIMTWLVTAAQPIAKTVDYVPLPDNVQKQALAVLGQME